MGHSNILNLDGGDPLSARLDDILDSVRDAHEAQGVNAGHISRAEPALPVHCWGWGLQAGHICTFSKFSIFLLNKVHVQH